MGHIELLYAYNNVINEWEVRTERRTRQTLWGGRTDASPKLLLYDT